MAALTEIWLKTNPKEPRDKKLVKADQDGLKTGSYAKPYLYKIFFKK